VNWLVRYLVNLSIGNLILWCYLIWYLVALFHFFDPNPNLWLTSLGISVIVGIALNISTTVGQKEPVKLGFWATFRLFLMPFCVSSFAALVKGHGFVLIFPPTLRENLVALGLCAAFCAGVLLLRRIASPAIGNK
jgi:hypothetical protein